VRPRTLTLWVAVAGASATVLITVLPFARFAYRSPAGHLALDTAAACVALLTAYLLFGRCRRTGRAGDFVMAFALTLFGFTNLLLSAVADVVGGPQRHLFATWAVLGSRLLATTLFAASAFIPETRLLRYRKKGFVVVLGALATVVALAAVELVVGPRLSPVIPPDLSPESSARPRIVGHPIVLALQLIVMALFAAAAVAFTRRAERTGDELHKWFGAAAALGAFARANYFLFPSLYSYYLYTGDFLRLGFYGLLLVGAAREIRAYWASLAEIAVLDERRRLARDIHDGLGQELSFIWSESHRSDDDDAPRRLERVSSAAERALEESRLAVAALTRPIDEPLDVAVARAARDVAHRVGVSVEQDLEEGLVVAPKTRDALLRVVREAVANAVRHGHAGVVSVRLAFEDELRLEVRDDGSGFDYGSASTTATGFGLASMRERVSSLNGRFEVESSPGQGAIVKAILPAGVAHRGKAAPSR
jgi:signal transduction histidine kinase